jgi:hypothetical protein
MIGGDLTEVKVCSICKTEKPIGDYAIFFSKETNRHRTRSFCKTCMREKSVEYGKRYRESQKQRLEENGLRKCSMCKKEKPMYEFDFHSLKYNIFKTNCKECEKMIKRPGKKICITCKKEKSVCDFYKSSKVGTRSQCKKCYKINTYNNKKYIFGFNELMEKEKCKC